VPAARIMVVVDADRFGLAQLHQLRGRVGRGGGASSCLLLARGARTSDAARRLAIMEETGDGFRIAEEDLAIRGPGEILGVKQAGLPRLRFADLTQHVALAAEARREAERLLGDDPNLERHAPTARVLEARTSAGAVTAEGG
jgi:ATP-dependent DNA helicase RecG